MDFIRVSCVREPGATTAPRLSEPATVAATVRDLIQGDEREHCYVFCLDEQNRVKSVALVSLGTMQASLVGARELFRIAIVSGAAGIIIAHNHPSGSAEPSREDIALTRRLKAVGELVGIPVLDHVIVGEDGFTSMAALSYWM